VYGILKDTLFGAGMAFKFQVVYGILKDTLFGAGMACVVDWV